MLSMPRPGCRVCFLIKKKKKSPQNCNQTKKKPKTQIAKLCNEKQENTNVFYKFARLRFSLLGYTQGKLY